MENTESFGEINIEFNNFESDRALMKIAMKKISLLKIFEPLKISR